MKTEYCLYVLDIAKTGSIRQAAEKNFITQQGLSQALKTVENELGVKIFERTGNRMTATPMGQVVLEQLQMLADSYQKLLQVISEQGQKFAHEPPTLTVYYTRAVGSLYLSTILSRLKKRHPYLRLKAYPEIPENLFTMEYDENTIAICGIPTEHMMEFMEQSVDRLKYYSIFQTPIICTVSQSSPYASYEYITQKDLLSIPLGLCAGDRNLLIREIGDISKANIVFESSDYYLIQRAFSSTSMASFSTAVAEYYLKRMDTVTIPYRPTTTIDYGCITCRGDTSLIVKDCVEIVRNELEKFQDNYGKRC